MAVIGVDIGGTKIAGLLIDPGASHPLVETWHHHQLSVTNTAVDVISESINELLTHAAGRGLNVTGAGVSVAGWLDVSRQHVAAAANLALTGSPLRELLQARLGVPVQVGNDGDCALLGELVAGAALGARNAALLAFGTGVGGGILLDGRLPVGGRGVAGELGHLPVLSTIVPPESDDTRLIAQTELCVCGGQGCLEQLTSGAALARTATRLRDTGRSPWLAALDGPLSARELGEAARGGDPASGLALDRVAEAVAGAIRILIPIVDPEVVVLGGSVVEGIGDLLLPRVVDALSREPRPMAALHPSPRVVPGAIHRLAAAFGAAQLLSSPLSGGQAIMTPQ